MPTTHTVSTSSIREISRAIAERAFLIRGGCTLQVSRLIWDQHTKDEREIFINICRIHGISYQVAGLGVGIQWVCPDVDDRSHGV
ncbi:MAG: hypothetical protein ACREX3_00275 [Gammaproteobacteria bacterium]